MSRLRIPPPLIYLVTSGQTTLKTNPNDPAFANILRLVEAAVASEIPLVQLREKALSARVLLELAEQCVRLTTGSKTRLLVNDRYDVALAASAHGVHLTGSSVPTEVVRTRIGGGLLIGVSTHSTAEARVAQANGADFVLFGPIFETESKRAYGGPQGTGRLRAVVDSVEGTPVIAIGGISTDNAQQCIAAGASGVAAIGLFSNPKTLPAVVDSIRAIKI